MLSLFYNDAKRTALIEAVVPIDDTHDEVTSQERRLARKLLETILRCWAEICWILEKVDETNDVTKFNTLISTWSASYLQKYSADNVNR